MFESRVWIHRLTPPITSTPQSTKPNKAMYLLVVELRMRFITKNDSIFSTNPTRIKPGRIYNLKKYAISIIFFSDFFIILNIIHSSILYQSINESKKKVNFKWNL
jgi:hypothetical protein